MMNEEVAEPKASPGPPMAETADTKAEPAPGISPEEDAPPTTQPASSEELGEDTAADLQLEPTQEDMERERLNARAEQLQDEILQLRKDLHDREFELAEVKKALGITPFTEFKESVAHGFKVVGDKWREVQETDTYRKTADTLSGWKHKVVDSDRYQKAKASLSEGGRKASDALSSAGTKIKESETMKKTSSALKRTGTAISSAASSLKTKVMASFDADNEDDNQPEMEPVPDKEETVVLDEPSKE